jgi:uncharacterized protein (TIGR03083 family)
MTDPGQTDLSGYVDVWWRSVCDFADLAATIAPEQWSAPTDLPGWDVRAVVSHVAHLEGILGGAAREEAEVPDAPHIRNAMGRFTEIGVITRRDADPAAIVAEIRRYSATRHEALLADPPTDPEAPAPGIFGAIGWSTATLLRNRLLDVAMHEQDLRRAIGRPGHLDSPSARHSADLLLGSPGYILAKRVKAEAGTTLVVEVEGHQPAAVTVDESGRGVTLAQPPADPPGPTVGLRMDRETFLLLAGGRRPAAARQVTVTGDADLATRVLAAMAVMM